MAWIWDRPKDSGKWHIFRTFGLRSLCGRWITSDPDADEVADGLLVPRKTDCRNCVKEMNRIRIAGRPWLKEKTA